ncbi:MAG: NADH-quinone oxidoreductase subunit M [Methylotetracoccus sp.]
MITTSLLLVLILGGLLAAFAERWNSDAPRWISLGALTLDVVLLAGFMAGTDAGTGPWLAETRIGWIPRFGIDFHLALDGLSLLLVGLTLMLGIASVLCSWTEIAERVGFFHFNLLWTLAGTLGVFLALDLFLFFFFWEVMIVPMYFLIALWGHERRGYAAMKFFLFTQVSGLLMLVAMIALALLYQARTGHLSFDYTDLLTAHLDADTQFYLMLGFFAAFVVKLPAVPFHTWLPDAHTQAPTGGSVILAGVLLKTGAYGLIRFVVPLFPDACREFSEYAMALGVAGILYGGALAFAQADIKRLIAYTSVSHMGFILIGVFAGNAEAMQGAIVTMLAHGISASALFMTAGALQQRLHTREFARMGGLWSEVPRLSAFALFFSVAALGMPGLANFIGEFLVLLGAYQVDARLTAFAALGLIVAPVYSLILVQRALHGEPAAAREIRDYGIREIAVMGVLMLATVAIGLYPGMVTHYVDGPVKSIRTAALGVSQQ